MIGKCCCILIGLFAGFLVFFGISTLVYVLVIAKTLPKALVHYEVTNASLTKFDLTGDSTFLDYNLTLNITLENPSPLNYNFNQLAAMPVFKNQTLNDMTNLSTSFYLEHESTRPTLFSRHCSPRTAWWCSGLRRLSISGMLASLILFWRLRVSIGLRVRRRRLLLSRRWHATWRSLWIPTEHHLLMIVFRLPSARKRNSTLMWTRFALLFCVCFLNNKWRDFFSSIYILFQFYHLLHKQRVLPNKYVLISSFPLRVCSYFYNRIWLYPEFICLCVANFYVIVT